nr:unnamed protein product [Callosobruchus analis]
MLNLSQIFGIITVHKRGATF